MYKIAIAGNPNSGKTTVFNVLSGKNERIGNWAGVTVMKKEALLKKKYNSLNGTIVLVDLPGAYSMDAYTNDEEEATRFIQNEEIDVIINVVDASNLERSLVFTSQLMKTSIPVIIALNKSDVAKRRKTTIDTEQMMELLQVPVIETIATRKKGINDLVAEAIKLLPKKEVNNIESTRQEKRHRRKRYRQKGRKKRCGCE